MLKPLLIASSLLFLACFFWAQEQKAPPAAAPAAPYAIPEEAVRQTNPVQPTPESLANGKKWYGYDCAMCHGASGDGKGGVAADMKLKVTDFTDPATLKARTDGELFYIIKNGKGDMPPEGPRVKTPELWNLVNYVRSLSKKKASQAEKEPHEEKAPN